MMRVVDCPHCGARGNGPDNCKPKAVRCKKCGGHFVIPPVTPAIQDDEPLDVLAVDTSPGPRRSPRANRAKGRPNTGLVVAGVVVVGVVILGVFLIFLNAHLQNLGREAEARGREARAREQAQRQKDEEAARQQDAKESAGAVHVTATDFFWECRRDSAAARARYDNKRLQISGVVMDLDRNPFLWGKPYLKLAVVEGDDRHSIRCEFLEKGKAGNLGELTQGGYVVLRGQCDGDAIKECKLVSCAAAPPADQTLAALAQKNRDADAKVAVAISATDLVREYKTNATAAERDRVGRWFTVSGVVYSTSAGTLGGPYVTFWSWLNENTRVQCEFLADQKSAWAKLAQGHWATVRGRCAGKGFGGEIAIDTCTLVSVSDDVSLDVAQLERKDREKRAEAEASERERKAEEEYESGGLVLLLKTVKATSDGVSEYITGTVVNRRSYKLKYAQITFSLYDESGAQVGTALANVNGLEPGGRWNFKALPLVNDWKRYKFSELSGF